MPGCKSENCRADPHTFIQNVHLWMSPTEAAGLHACVSELTEPWPDMAPCAPPLWLSSSGAACKGRAQKMASRSKAPRLLKRRALCCGCHLLCSCCGSTPTKQTTPNLTPGDVTRERLQSFTTKTLHHRVIACAPQLHLISRKILSQRKSAGSYPPGRKWNMQHMLHDHIQVRFETHRL